MGNYTPAMFQHWMQDIILDFHQGTSLPDCRKGIALLDGLKPLSPDYLFIGESTTVETILKEYQDFSEPVFIICSGRLTSFTLENLPEQLSLLSADLPLLNLYNRVHSHTYAFRDWDRALQEVIFTNSGLQSLLVTASQMIKATIVLVNGGYKHMAACYDECCTDPTAEELRSLGYQTFETIRSVLSQKPVEGDFTGSHVGYVYGDSGYYHDVRLIRYRGDLVARLCLIMPQHKISQYAIDINVLLAEYVSQYLFSHHGMDYNSSAAFGSLAADLIEYRLTDPKELADRLLQTQLAVRRSYHMILVSLDDLENRKHIPWNYIMNQLQYIFPFSNITAYEGKILMIVRKKHRGSRLRFDKDRFIKLLAAYQARACVSNSSEFLTSLPILYRQSLSSLKFAFVLHPEKRIIFYEEYSIYQVVELAAEGALRTLNINNPLHLCNNELIVLNMYDKKAGTNLVHMLHVYLMNERNTTVTAQKLFMHRNTLINKIHQIEKIIGTDLEDPRLRERLLFSCRVMEYMTLYKKEDLLSIKQAHPDLHSQ